MNNIDLNGISIDNNVNDPMLAAYALPAPPPPPPSMDIHQMAPMALDNFNTNWAHPSIPTADGFKSIFDLAIIADAKTKLDKHVGILKEHCAMLVKKNAHLRELILLGISTNSLLRGQMNQLKIQLRDESKRVDTILASFKDSQIPGPSAKRPKLPPIEWQLRPIIVVEEDLKPLPVAKCIVCCEREINVILLPCSHASMCRTCYDRLPHVPVPADGPYERILDAENVVVEMRPPPAILYKRCPHCRSSVTADHILVLPTISATPKGNSNYAYVHMQTCMNSQAPCINIITTVNSCGHATYCSQCYGTNSFGFTQGAQGQHFLKRFCNVCTVAPTYHINFTFCEI